MHPKTINQHSAIIRWFCEQASSGDRRWYEITINRVVVFELFTFHRKLCWKHFTWSPGWRERRRKKHKKKMFFSSKKKCIANWFFCPVLFTTGNVWFYIAHNFEVVTGLNIFRRHFFSSSIWSIVTETVPHSERTDYVCLGVLMCADVCSALIFIS